MNSSLEWSLLVDSFMKFRSRADKIGFYTPELDHMEQSLLDIRPVKGLEFTDVIGRSENKNVASI